MSGGHWNYTDETLKDEIFGYDEENKDPLGDLELSQLLLDMLKLLHEYDWFVSGDTGGEDWYHAKRKFKERWLSGDRSENLKRLIDERLDEVGEELRAML